MSDCKLRREGGRLAQRPVNWARLIEAIKKALVTDRTLKGDNL
ncbi:MAG: hypothetical protein CSYNP_02244 [Syntrophus sp. SKADARSKE-3]|nr:hypothetical protein [Syntrophus sp. SKADARSKE-3]